MRLALLEILRCPGCGGRLEVDTTGVDPVREGTLACRGCASTYPIVSGIPRFVQRQNYASSFGLQWNRFRLEQIDRTADKGLSHSRFYSETGWEPETLRGKWVLDAGCGAGRFLAVVAETGAWAVGVDLSDAVDAAALTLRDKPDVDLVQARIDALPFAPAAFDAVYCIGVIQHTSDPQSAVRSLARAVRPGGRIAITAYEKRRWTHLYAKYWARRLTSRLGDRALLRLVYLTMPLLFPLTEILYRIPLLGRFFRFVIPVANYVEKPELSLGQRYRWALLDTYDMLAPTFDFPQTEAAVARWLRDEGVGEVERRRNPGLNLAGRRTTPHEP